MNRARPFLGIVLLAACSTNADKYDRPYVSAGLEERTGRGLGPGDESFPGNIKIDDGVTESEAVEIALWRNAAFQEALAEMGLRRADLVQAGVFQNPVLSFLFPAGTKQIELALKLPIEAIWLRPARVAAAEFDCERMAALLVQGGLDLVRDVKSAFADLRLATRRVVLTGEVATLAAAELEIEMARVRAGDTSERAVALRRADAERARSSAAKAARDGELAAERIRSLMGLGHDPRPLEFRREPAEARSVDRPEAELLKDALAARPDIRAAEMGVQAAAERVGIAGWEWLTVAAVGDANDRAGNKGLEGGPGVEVPLPVFNRSPGGVARAEAEVERAARHLAAVRHRVALEICSARLALIRAEEGVRATRERVIPALQESLRIAERAHQAGETSLAPVLESRRRLSEAALEEAEERAALERARAELERSVGRRLE